MSVQALHSWVSIHHMIVFFCCTSLKWWHQCFFDLFKILVFWVVRVEGVKSQKMAQSDKKICITSYLRNFTSYDCGFWYTCVKWWYLQKNFFHFFESLIFLVFQNLSIKSKRKFCGVSHLPHMCVIVLLNYDFVPAGVIKDRITKTYPKCLNGKLSPYDLSCFINSFLCDPANKAWLFEHFIFELEAFYCFKITCILVRQVISVTKNGGVISKIYCLIFWSPGGTPLILVSASVKMASNIKNGHSNI